MKKGRVHSIFIAPAAGERMQMVQEVRAISGVGLSGDRYAKGMGKFSSKDGPPESKRNVTLIALGAIIEVNNQPDVLFPYLPSETRRNIVIEGITAQELNDHVGKVLMLGRVFVRVVELCHPCNRPSKLCEKPGFKEAFKNRGGVRAEILSSGKITAGDDILLSLDF